MEATWQPDIYHYLDYRAYLRDYYHAGKEATSHMSFRYLSRRAGFSSPNYVKLVMDGERNLSVAGARKVAKALALNREATAFFLDLVVFTQSEDVDERNAAFERIGASQHFREARRIDSALFEYLSHWYYPAIREMVARDDFRPEPGWIARQLVPPIKVTEAERALALLEELGLIVEVDGRWERGEPTLTTGHEVSRLAVGNYHRQMLSLAAGSIEHVRASHRHLSATTMCIDEATFQQLLLDIRNFRESMIESSERSDARDRIYQLNVQFFPLSQPEEEEP